MFANYLILAVIPKVLSLKEKCLRLTNAMVWVEYFSANLSSDPDIMAISPTGHIASSAKETFYFIMWLLTDSHTNYCVPDNRHSFSCTIPPDIMAHFSILLIPPESRAISVEQNRTY